MPVKNPMRDYITNKMGAKPEPIGGFEDATEYEPEAEPEPTEPGDCVSVYLRLPAETRRKILAGDLDSIESWRDAVGEA